MEVTMSTLAPPATFLPRPLTYDDLIAMPDDGQRYELINGEVCASPAPHRVHQELVGRTFLLLHTEGVAKGLGKVYVAPVDVRLSPYDIVQPDLIFLRRDRLHLYQGSVVGGPPDIVGERISPSTRQTDLVRKAALYARAGVPECWQADTDAPAFQLLTLREGLYQTVQPDEHGRLRSVVLPDLVIDPDVLFAHLG